MQENRWRLHCCHPGRDFSDTFAAPSGYAARKGMNTAYLDLHGCGCTGCDLLVHTVSNAREHGGSCTHADLPKDAPKQPRLCEVLLSHPKPICTPRALEHKKCHLQLIHLLRTESPMMHRAPVVMLTCKETGSSRNASATG